MENKSILSLENIKLSYTTNSNDMLEVIKDITISINEHEIVALLGPSGCGKSSLLNIISGEENNFKGKINFKSSNNSNYNNCEFGFLFQKPILFNWLTVKENIAFGLKVRKVKKKEREELIKEYIKSVGLNGFENYYPNELSGGMQQRVALARILILKPYLLLMDEPFAALDTQLRHKMQQLVLKLWQEHKQSIVFVTHDIEEAIIISHRIYILSSRPSYVVSEIEVPFKNKQDTSYIDTYEFIQLKNEIKNILVSC